jgi:hypothetical protein
MRRSWDIPSGARHAGNGVPQAVAHRDQVVNRPVELVCLGGELLAIEPWP